MSENKQTPRDTPGFMTYYVVGVYAVFGGLWILLSDRLLAVLEPNPVVYATFQTYKGWLYVAVTAVLLYFMIRRALERTRRLEDEKKSSEVKFLHAQKMELVGRLASGVAHDFNNVLTAIMGLAQMTAPTLPREDPRRADLEDIVKIAGRASALTSQLLVFSRKQQAQPRALDLCALIREEEKMLRRAVGGAVELELDLAGDLCNVKADPLQMDQVLLNLALNARDAMPNGGKLLLSAAVRELTAPLPSSAGEIPAGQYLVLTARDNGQGMDQATAAQVFEPFFTTKDPGQGTGLGLSVVRDIVKQSGGYITVESRPGTGTAFRIYLPEYCGPGESPAAAAAPLSAPGGSETILLADDQPEIMPVLRRILEARGYKVLCAGNYDEAVNQAAVSKSSVQLLVADLLMPGKTGPDLADMILSMYPGSRVLFISGNTEDVTVREKILARHRPFLPKPFAPEAFLAKVRETLDSPAA